MIIKIVLFVLLEVASTTADTSHKVNATECHNNVIKRLAHQLIRQQFYVEEKTRSDGDSGIKQIRYTVNGHKLYEYPSHAGLSFAAIHDHANNIRIVGMGETVVVLNGVEFRTRHNDFQLRMASTSSSQFHATQDIQFPSVPPEVLQKTPVKEQVLEMREWFKAWAEQNYTVRDYRPYFKPVLCYLEGAWTRSEEKIHEPFESERHFIDAKFWDELGERLRFLAYSGTRHPLENFAYLPKVVFNITEDGIPIFAQWNYRIVCHPVQRDIPLKCFNVVDDLKSRMIHKETLAKYKMSRNARFALNSVDTDCLGDGRYDSEDLLESLMREIPGKENYMGNLRDHGYAGLALDPMDKTPLNTAFYHRKYSLGRADASGHTNRYRGFSDKNLFMAMTQQKQVLGMEFNSCNSRAGYCETTSQKWTYAIPLEIIFMTPLSKWNPFKVEYRGTASSPQGQKVSHGRVGSEKMPYDGTNSRLYFQTPKWFFSGDEVDPDPADTSPNDVVFVLDPKGKRRKMTASGHRIFFPHISGTGVLRQRYPIAPVHGEGGAVWKELDALKELVLNPKTNCQLLHEDGCH